MTGTGFHVLTHVPREFNDENVPSCYSTAQHKPEVVDYYEPLRDFFEPDTESVYAPKRKS